LVGVILECGVRVRIQDHVRVAALLLQLHELLKGDLALLVENELALLNQSRRCLRTVMDVENEVLEHEFDRLYQVMQEEPEFVVEKRLDNLIVEEDTFGQPGALRAVVDLLRMDYRELLLENLEHFSVLYLKGTHYVFSTNKQVHHAGHEDPWGVLPRVVAQG
jgi:hypothetical protein